MPPIPFIQRQQGIPNTTGVPAPPVVQTQDQIGNALGNVGNTLEKVSDDLFKAEATSQLNTRTTNLQLRLNDLENELSAGDPTTALGTYEQRVKKIYEQAGYGIVSPIIKEQFDEKFNILSQKSIAAIKGKAIVKRYDQLKGGLYSDLNSLAKGIGLDGKEIDINTASITGVRAIDAAVKGNVIKAAEGAKLKIKFSQDMAENTMTGWILRQKVGDWKAAFAQINAGKFTDSAVQNAWELMDEQKRLTFMSKLVTNIDRTLDFKDAQDLRKKRELEKTGLKLMKEFYLADPSDPKQRERQNQILDLLAKNETIGQGVYDKMLRDYTGRTNRFRPAPDPAKTSEYKRQIMANPGDFNPEDIIRSNLPNKDELLEFYDVRMDKRYSRAIDMINSHPEFIPGSPIERKYTKDQLTDKKAAIISKVQYEATAARAKNEPFDAVARAQELIREFVSSSEILELKKSDAMDQLKALGITSMKQFEAYISRRMQKGKFTITDRARLEELASKAGLK